MREGLLDQIEIICPRCRRAGNDSVSQFPVRPTRFFKKEADFVLEGWLTCSNDRCGSIFPILDGIPVVLKDMKSWWSAQRSNLSCLRADAPELRRHFEQVESDDAADFAERCLLACYMDSHYGKPMAGHSGSLSQAEPVEYWDTVIRMGRPGNDSRYDLALDLGCSVGRWSFELARFSRLAVGIDLDFGKVAMAARLQRNQKVIYERRVRGRQFEKVETSYAPSENVLFLVADALDPPFRAESFDLVAGLSLVDNVKLPLVLIGQMDALLRKGGYFILGAPYEWRADICDPVEWLETDERDAPQLIREILEGTMFRQMGLKYELVQEVMKIPWVLRNHSRHWSFYLTHLVKARKPLH